MPYIIFFVILLCESSCIYLKHLKYESVMSNVKLTSWRIFQYASVIIMTWNYLQGRFCHGFTARVPSKNFYLACVVLSGLWNIEMVHAIIGKFVTMAVGDGVTIDQPHDPWFWMTCDTTTESGPFTFFYSAWFWFGHKYWGLSWFGFFRNFIRCARMNFIIRLPFYPYNYISHI